MNFYVVSSLTKEFTYFIFRRNGVEVKVNVENNNLISSRYITPQEREYFKKYILEIRVINDKEING